MPHTRVLKCTPVMTTPFTACTSSSDPETPLIPAAATIPSPGKHLKWAEGFGGGERLLQRTSFPLHRRLASLAAQGCVPAADG